MLGAIDVVVTPLDETPEAEIDAAAVLSADERRRASRFAFQRDRRRYIVGRARLRQLLATRLGVSPATIGLGYGPRGKPRLAGRFAASGWQFNVSHADQMAAFVFARGRSVGIDIEAVRALPDADDVADRAFSPLERRTYAALDAQTKPQGFFNCWTRKEAFVKALGAGLFHRLDRFDVTLAHDEPARILRVDRTPGDRCRWALHSVQPAPGFACALVVQRSPKLHYGGWA